MKAETFIATAEKLEKDDYLGFSTGFPSCEATLKKTEEGFILWIYGISAIIFADGFAEGTTDCCLIAINEGNETARIGIANWNLRVIG